MEVDFPTDSIGKDGDLGGLAKQNEGRTFVDPWMNVGFAATAGPGSPQGHRASRLSIGG